MAGLTNLISRLGSKCQSTEGLGDRHQHAKCSDPDTRCVACECMEWPIKSGPLPATEQDAGVLQLGFVEQSEALFSAPPSA